MTKTDLQELMTFVKDRVLNAGLCFEYFDYATQGSQLKLQCNMNTLLDIIELFPTSDETSNNDPCTEDALMGKYESFLKAGFDPAQAFDLTRAFYENELQKRKE